MSSASRPPRPALIVDDDAASRQAVAVALARRGFDAVAAGSPAQARLELDRRAFDLLAIALRPTDAALALVEEARARGVALIIAWAERVTVDSAAAAVRRGAADLLAAPVRADDVLIALRKAEERVRRDHTSPMPARAASSAAGPSDPADPADPADPLGRLVAASPRMVEILRVVRKIAGHRTTVLVTGESGTGKEMIARAVHDASPRRDAPFVAVNCAAIPEALLESELFGHRRGAFTDAVRDKPGLFEEASGGTLFLDEIGDLPLGLQVKILRALQEQEIRPVGANADVKIDVRLIAATARDLQADIAAGRFREDLFYRLNVVPIVLPPLRERREEIPPLVERFIHRTNRKLGLAVAGISAEALRLLGEYAWPGNVRELENTIERAMIFTEGAHIDVDGLPERVRLGRDPVRDRPGPAGGDLSIKRATRAVEEELIRRALRQTRGNRTNAAKLLEISHRALLYKIKEYGIADR